jgi:hypothetical protein
MNKNVFFQKQRTGRQNRSCLGGVVGRGREDVRKWCKIVNMVEIYTHVCKWELRPFGEGG